MRTELLQLRVRPDAKQGFREAVALAGSRFSPGFASAFVRQPFGNLRVAAATSHLLYLPSFRILANG